MLMADTMAIFFVILGLLLALPSLWLLCSGLWPDAVTAASIIIRKNLFKPFFIGLPITVVILLIAGAMNKLLPGLGNIGAGALISIYFVYASIGVAGLSRTIGHRLKSISDTDQPWKATLRGSIIVALTYLLPILGWFVILPVSMIIGAGAVTMSLLKFKQTQVVDIPDVNNRRVATGTAITADLP